MKVMNKEVQIDTTTLYIPWTKVLLVGFWWNKNMWDELILLGNIKLLLAQEKKVFVISQNTSFLKKFLSQFIDIQQITFLQELPRGFRSGMKYFLRYLSQLRYFWEIDEIILWGGEILTEENYWSYWYRLWSIWPALHFKNTHLTIMWGVQIPKKKKNLLFFKEIVKHTRRMYLRDFQSLENVQHFWYQKAEFFMDTSYFALEDWKKNKGEPQHYIVVNINSNGEKFLWDIVSDALEYVKKWYTIYYLPVCEGRDDDLVYLPELQKRLGKKAKIEILNRSEDFHSFLKILWSAEKVIGTRLHLYLISKFIGLETIVYPYQRKIIRMQEVFSEIIL